MVVSQNWAIHLSHGDGYVAASHSLLPQDTIDLSEQCIRLFCTHALETVPDGWAWLGTLDVVLQKSFRDRAVHRQHMAALAAEAGAVLHPPTHEPTYNFVFMVFAKSILEHLCDRFASWQTSPRPFITILAAKETSTFIANVCRYVAYLLPRMTAHLNTLYVSDDTSCVLVCVCY